MAGLEANDPFAANGSDAERLADLLSRGHSLLELAAIESRSAEPLLGHLVRRGQRTIIGGYGGAGKSTFGMAIVQALVGKNSMLGFQTPDEDLHVVYLDLEQDVDTAKRRVGETWYGKKYVHGESDLIALMKDAEEFERVTYYLWGEGVNLAEPGVGRDAFQQVIEERQPDVLVVDPLYKLLWGNPNEAETIMKVVMFIDELRVKHGCAVVLPMHMRKPGKAGGATFSMHDLYGAALWSWWAEVIVGLRRVGEGRQSELHFFKDRQGDLPMHTHWTISLDERLGWVNDAESMSARTWENRIWEMLQKPENTGRWMTRKEIKAWFGDEASEATIRNETQRMMKNRNMGVEAYRALENRGGKGGKPIELRHMPATNSLIDHAKETMNATEVPHE